MSERKTLKERRKIMTRTYDVPIEAFEQRYFWLFNKMESYEELDDYRVFVFLDDGRTILYNNVTYESHEVKLFNSVSELMDDEWKKGFSDLLITQMRRAKMSQCVLADRIGVTNAMMNRYASGQSIPSAFILNRIVEELDCSADDLFPRKYIILD